MPYGRCENPATPCYGCKERNTGCHSNCSKYKDWNTQRIENNIKISRYLHPVGVTYVKRAVSKIVMKNKMR